MYVFSVLAAGGCSPEKAGVGGSIPSLATINSTPYNGHNSRFGHNWSQFRAPVIRLFRASKLCDLPL
jgi:hypothetical protein